MKRLILTTLLAVAGWLISQAQSMPAPEKYNEFIEQVAAQDPFNAEFLMQATMESLKDNPKGYRQMLELAERRFSDPADPIHNENLYMIVLKHATEKYVLSNTEKEKQRLLLEGAKKNMIGTVAADFDYVTAGDKTVHHLKDLKADNILVYFNNPDCESCEVVKQRLDENEYINQLVKDQKLIVLAIYPYENQKLWKKAKYPKMMINGWNQSQNIEYGELYDLPTLPCFYLLDKNYTVLVKNEGSLNKVEAKLKELASPQAAGPAPGPMPELQANEPQVEKKQEQPKQQLTPKKGEKPEVTLTPAPADDPFAIRSEQILNLVLNNQGEEIYNSLSDKVKEQTRLEMFENILSQVESKAGKYQSHESWEIQQLQNAKAYVSVMDFENVQLAFILMYDDQGKITVMNFAPAQVVKK